MQSPTHPYILMLEDDQEDRYITESFFAERNYNIGLVFVTNGHEVMEYLELCRNTRRPLPSLILLDKNVPIGSGIEVLRELKSHRAYRGIPTVIISGTAFEHEVDECYQLGVNSYIVKPTTNDMTAEKIGTFVQYWFSIVELPQSALSGMAAM